MNTNVSRLASLLLIPALATACGPDESPSSDTGTTDVDMADVGNPKEDMPADMTPDLDVVPDSGPDTRTDMPTDMEGDTDVPDLCEPLTQCPEKACGEVMDGCGGTLECGACACDEGNAVAQVCGPCGLGVSRCEEGVSSSEIASCEYPGGHDILGEITMCDQVVYVDAQAEANGDGSQLLPFSTYAEALATFGVDEKGAIIVDEGTYFEQLRLQDGVHVFSGYARLRDSWIQKPSSLAAFVSPRLVGAPAIGLRAQDMSAPTVVHSVQVEPPDALPEETTYGAYLRNVSGLTISSSIILGKEAGAGVDGAQGVAGASGGDGEVGMCALVAVGVRGSDGGASGVNASCPQADGGRGGAGAVYEPPNMTNARGLQGADGADGTSTGGAPGELGTSSTQQASGKDAVDLAEYAESVAQSGTGGVAGGMLIDGFWVSTGDGTSGTDGAAGSGGGGGGGAGGNSTRAQEMGGGGGGAGGCGGTAGTRGSAGGTSFGLLAMDTEATLVDSVVYGRRAGRGGLGAQGGDAGLGGEGARGTNRDCTQTVRVWSSGDGADGMDGQAGGSGGGGASGDAYGAYCEGSTLIVENSTFEAGRAGTPGQGDSPGEQGRVEDEMNCR